MDFYNFSLQVGQLIDNVMNGLQMKMIKILLICILK